MEEAKKAQKSLTLPDVLELESDHRGRLEELLDNGRFSDLTLVVGERQFHAHRAILEARMPKLAAKFRPELPKQTIIVNNIKPEVFQELLRFAYAGRVREFGVHYKDLTIAACISDMSDLVMGCATAFFRNAEEVTTLDAVRNNPVLTSLAGEAAVAKLVEQADGARVHGLLEFYGAVVLGALKKNGRDLKSKSNDRGDGESGKRRL